MKDDASPATRRHRVIVAIAVSAAALSTIGTILSFSIKSPGQAAAELSPAPPSSLTATVEKQVLKRTVAVRGRVQPSKVVPLTPVYAAGPGAAVVTALPLATGTAVSAGDVVAQISGRPVIALPGNTPAYRDLAPGTVGEDVLQLQQALASLGYLPMSGPDGRFGVATRSAVAALYRDRGFDAAVSHSQEQNSPDATDAAQEELVAAERRLAQHRLAFTLAPDEAVRADLALQIDFDQKDVDRARRKADEAEALSGARIPLGEVLFVPGGEGRVGSVAAAVGTRLEDLGGAILTIDVGELTVSASVPAGSHADVNVGQPVTVEDDARGISVSGTVVSLATHASSASAPDEAASGSSPQGGAPGGGDSGAPGAYPVIVELQELLDPTWTGKDVRLTVVTGQTDGPVLVVPQTAIRTSKQGDTTVAVLRKDGTRDTVAVEIGMMAEGRVEVRSDSSKSLAHGDRVVTG